MKYKTSRKNKAETLENCEFLYFDENKNCEVWRASSGKLVFANSMDDEVPALESLEERQLKNRGHKICENESPIFEVNEAKYEGDLSNPIPENFVFKGVVHKANGESSVIDLESKNSLSLSQIAEIILG